MHKDRTFQKIQDDVISEQRQKHVHSRRIVSRNLTARLWFTQRVEGMTHTEKNRLCVASWILRACTRFFSMYVMSTRCGKVPRSKTGSLAIKSTFHLVTQVDTSIVLSLLFIECQKDRTMFMSTCVIKWKTSQVSFSIHEFTSHFMAKTFD